MLKGVIAVVQDSLKLLCVFVCNCPSCTTQQVGAFSKATLAKLFQRRDEVHMAFPEHADTFWGSGMKQVAQTVNLGKFVCVGKSESTFFFFHDDLET